MEAVIDDALGDVFDLDPRRCFERPAIDDALVRDEAVLSGIERRIVLGEATRHVVGVEDRHLGGLHQSFASHQRDVCPGDRQDPRAAPRRGRDSAARLLLAQRHHRMVRQERPQVLRHADRPHPRAAAPVWDAKRLVEVQVAHVRSDVGRPDQPHLRVHVGTVHVHLSAVRVNDLANLADGGLEHAMRRRIGHHQCHERVLVLDGFGPKVRDVDVAAGVRLDGHDSQAGHHGARGIGAVRRVRDQARGPVALPARAVIRLDHEQPGELTLRARVRLQRDLREAGDFCKHVLELAEQRAVPGGLLSRRERMQPVELTPRQRDHLGRGVQLHGARPKGNHGGGKGQVARFEPLDIAEHLGLGAVPMKHRMRQVG